MTTGHQLALFAPEATELPYREVYSVGRYTFELEVEESKNPERKVLPHMSAPIVAIYNATLLKPWRGDSGMGGPIEEGEEIARALDTMRRWCHRQAEWYDVYDHRKR